MLGRRVLGGLWLVLPGLVLLAGAKISYGADSGTGEDSPSMSFSASPSENAGWGLSLGSPSVAETPLSVQEVLSRMDAPSREKWEAFLDLPRNPSLTQEGNLLRALYERAKSSDAGILAEEAKFRSAKGAHVGDIGKYLPDLSVSAGASAQKQDCKLPQSNPLCSSGKGNQTTLSLSAKQAIYDQSLIYNIKGGGMRRDAAAFTYQAQSNQLLIDLFDAMLSLAVHDSEIKSLSSLVEQTRRQEEITKVRVQSGQETRADLYKIEQQKFQTEYLLAQRKILRSETLQTLERLTGLPFPGKVSPALVAWDAPKFLLMNLQEPWLDLVVAHDPSYHAAILQSEAAHDMYKGVASNYIPKLSAYAQYTRTNGQNTPEGSPKMKTKQDEMVLGFSLDLDLSRGFFETSQSKADYQTALYESDLALQKLKIGTSANLESVRVGVYQLSGLHRAAEAAELAYTISQSRYAAGQESLNDLLDSESKYYDSLKTFNDELKNWILNQLSLLLSAERFDLSVWDKLGGLLILKPAAVASKISGDQDFPQGEESASAPSPQGESSSFDNPSLP